MSRGSKRVSRPPNLTSVDSIVVPKDWPRAHDLDLDGSTRKTRSIDDIVEMIAATKSIASKSRSTRSANAISADSSLAIASDQSLQPSSTDNNMTSQRPGLTRRGVSSSSISTASCKGPLSKVTGSISRRVSFGPGHLRSHSSPGQDKTIPTNNNSTNMNPKTSPQRPKSACSNSSTAAVLSNTDTHEISKGNTNTDSCSSPIALVTSSPLVSSLPLVHSDTPSTNINPSSFEDTLPVSTVVPARASPTQSSTSSMTPSSVRNASANPDFNPEEFRIQLLRQFTDMLETDLDRHLTHLASASSMSISSNNNNGSNGHVDTRSDRSSTYSSVSHGSDTSTATATTTALKKELRRVTAECVRITEKNQKLMDDNHKLEMKNLDTCHQLSRLQSNVANNNRFFMARGGNDPRSSSCLGSTTDGYNGGGEPLEWDGSTTSASSSTQVQQLMHKVSVLTSERDTLKIRVWELEKKPFDQQFAIRSTDYVDLEHERNRLVEELGIKTVAMEELWNRNEGLMIRAKEYENRVWELETQCSSLEAECASLPTIHADLSDLQARAVKADALAHKLQGLESQQTMVKTLQARVQELETSNAELDHSNWDLSERLNIANNQHALLTKEFESFRSKDKDDRRLEFLANRNRELESLLQEQVKTTTSCHKEDCDRLTIDYEKAKLRLLQLEGQAKQVSLFRTKTQQLEKQIKTMEQLEPRLDEMQHLYERNLFLEGELGELELLRARELELEGELRESKARLVQLASVNVNVSVNGNGQAASFVDVDKKTTQPLAGVQLAPGSDAECQTNPLSHVDQKDGLNANGSVVDTLREDVSRLAIGADTSSSWPSGRSRAISS